MSEILNIPAGVIQPKDLLIYLRNLRLDADEMADEYEEQDGLDAWDTAFYRGRADAFRQVIQRIQFSGVEFGGAS